MPVSEKIADSTGRRVRMSKIDVASFTKEKEMFYLTTHSAHSSYGDMESDVR